MSRDDPPMSGVPTLPTLLAARSASPPPHHDALADTARAMTALEGAERIVLDVVRLGVPGTSTALSAALSGIRRAQAELHAVLRRLAQGPDGPPADDWVTGAPPTKRA